MLAGEYAVLFDFPALVAAVDCRATTTAQPAKGFWVQGLGPEPVAVKKQNGNLHFESESAKGDVTLFEHALRHFFAEAPLPELSLRVDTERFFHTNGQKIGLGSSAAATVSLTATLLHHLKKGRPTTQEILQHALAIHRQLNDGLGSGADIAASTLGGLIKYQKQGPQTRHLPPWQNDGWKLQCVFTGHSQSTKAWVKTVLAWAAQHPQRSKETIGSIHQSTLAVLSAVEQQNGKRLMASFNQAQEALRDLGDATALPIIGDRANAIHQMAVDFGGGAKPSGAGGGDICLTLIPAPKADDFSKQLEKNGFSVVEWPPFPAGCHPLAPKSPID